MKCEDARAEVLAGDPSAEVERHMASCPSCRGLGTRLTELSAALGEAAVWVEPPVGMEERVLAVLDTEASQVQRPSPRAWMWGAVAVLAAVVAAGAVVASLRSPPADWEVEVVGEASVAPLMTGTVAGWNTEGGTRVVLDADNLPHAPEGHVYELWFIGEAAPISAGTFSGAEEPVELAVGIARRDFPRVVLTLEPLDGDPAPSDVVVFDSA